MADTKQQAVVIELILEGSAPGDRATHRLDDGRTLVLGREESDVAVPWERSVSRQHAALRWADGHLEVRRLPSGQNPIFFRGNDESEFRLAPGEFFVIGDTRFTLAGTAPAGDSAPSPEFEHTFSIEELSRCAFSDPDLRIRVLADLPTAIGEATNDDDLCRRIVAMLRAGVEKSVAAAVVVLKPCVAGAEPELEVAYSEGAGPLMTAFRPSTRLVHKAHASQHSETASWQSRNPTGQSDMTVMEGVDWAICTPVRSQSCGGWFLYIAGRATAGYLARPAASHAPDLRGDVKFTELVASILGQLREVRSFQHRESIYNQFFSRRVASAIANRDPADVLRERVTEVVVLFCDLRGFSAEVERAEREGNLVTAYHRVRDALGIATRHVLAQEGVIGDFHGDAVMGFWGWPEAQPDMVARACLAALGIRRELREIAQAKGHPLSHFDMGIGIALGNALAGRIGTEDQVKVTVFGSIVNLASRLEGMTKILHAPVIVESRIGDFVRSQLKSDVVRCRRLGTYRPYGLAAPVDVTEILPPAAEHPDLSDDDISYFEQALEQLRAGDWEQALKLFHRVPPSDQAKDLLVTLIYNHGRRPPDDWDGVIALEKKS